MPKHIPTANETPVSKYRLGKTTLADLDLVAAQLGRTTAVGRPNRAEAIRHLAQEAAEKIRKKKK